MAKTLSEFRKSYPQYDDLDDETLARALHEKHYSDIDFGEFSKQIGYSAAPAEPAPVREKETAPRKAVDTPEQRQARDTLAVQQMAEPSPVTSSAMGGGPLGLSAPRTAEERMQERGRVMERMVDIGQRRPEDYGLTQRDFDKLMDDGVQNIFAARNARVEEAEAQGVPPQVQKEAEEEETRSRWLIASDMIRTLGKRRRQRGVAMDMDKLEDDFRYRELGAKYLKNVSESYGDLSDQAKDVIEQSANKYGVDTETYYQMLAQQVDDMAEYAVAEYDLANAMDKENLKGLPKIENFSDNPLGYLANLAVQNTDSAAYMAIGAVTRSPHVLGYLMGTDVYTRQYAESRADGRSRGESTLDATYSAAIEGITEGIPLGRILSRAGKPMSRKRKIFEAMRDEALQEMAVEVLQTGYDVGIIGDEFSAGEAFIELRDAGMVGAMFGGGMAAPYALTGDIQMENVNKDLKEATDELKSVALQVRDTSQKLDRADIKSQIARAQENYRAAASAKRKLVEEREQAELEKKEAKQQKKTEKRRKKMTPVERKRDIAREKQAKSDQKIEGAPTKEDIDQADLMERIGKREVSEEDAEGVSALLDAGYATVSPSGAVILNDAAKRRLKAVREAQEEPKALPAPKDVEERIEPTPFKRKPLKAPDKVPPSAKPSKIKPKKFTSAKKRREQIIARVDAKVKDEETRGKIADAIIKAEQEDKAFADLEKRQVKEQEKKRDEDYQKALNQLNKEEADVAVGLAQMDEKSISGYQGTQLGDILRDAMKAVEKAEKKATKELKDAFWNKPVQGTLFDVSTVLAKGTKDYANVVKVGALKLAKIGLKYSAWSADMIGQFGESIRPVLAKVYADSKKNLKNVVRISHERFKSGPRKGQLKYSPAEFAEGRKVDRLRRQLEKMVREGETGRFWYEKTGAGILKATGNIEEARLLAGLLAIYSSGTAVSANLTNALKMWADYKAGKLKMPKSGTKAGRFREQDRTALAWLQSNKSDAHFVESFGPKRFPFFTNIMRVIDPDNYEFGQGATVDLWIMRAFGYLTDAPTDPQNAFSATEMQKIAEKVGWEVQQVQAAIWVTIKARWEFIQKGAKQRAVDEGLAEFIPQKKGQPLFEVLGSTRAEKIQNEKRIISIFREEALRVSKKDIQAKLKESARDFVDYMDRHYATISWEAEPSTSLGLDINKMPLHAKIEMQAEIAKLLTNPETGREYLAEWLGLIGMDQFHGPGAWEMNVGSAVQNSVLAPTQHKAKEKVSESSASALDGYAAILGFLLQQDAVAWHKPYYESAQWRSNGVEIVGPTLTYGQTKALYAHIVEVATNMGVDPNVAMQWAPIVMDGSFRVLNFDMEMPPPPKDPKNKTEEEKAAIKAYGDNLKRFHKIIEEAANRAGINGHMERFRSDGNYLANNWNENTKGETYVNQISNSKNPEVQKAFKRAKRKFGKGLKAIYAKYAREYKAYPSQPAHVVPAKLAKKKKKGTIRFRHFSKAEPSTIRVDKFGTGIKGEGDSYRQAPVISAYPDKGFKKEPGLGQHEYVIDVRKEDLYNLSEDPLNLKDSGVQPQTLDGNMKAIGWRTDMNRVEMAIKEAGYIGFYTPDADGNLKGQARFFVDLPVQQREGVELNFSIQDSPVIQVRENEFDEFEVRERNGEIAYESDPDAAIDTARYIWGDRVTIELVDEFGEVRDVIEPSASPERIKMMAGKADIYTGIEELIDEFVEDTWGNPLSPDERVFDDGVALSIRPQGDHIFLDSIRSFEKGAGMGGAALDYLIELADRHGVVYKMIAKPFGEGGLNQAQLVAWYKSRGFVFEGSGHTMVRMPQNPEVHGKFGLADRLRALGPEHHWLRVTEKVTNAGMGIPVKEAEGLAQSFANMLGLPVEMFRVVESAESLPAESFIQVAKAGAAGTVQGLYTYDAIDGPLIYIVANNLWEQSPTKDGTIEGPINTKFGLPSVRMLQEVLTHETLGHFGLQAFLGEKKYNQFMDAIRDAFPEEVAERGVDMRASAWGRRLAAEEVFAYRVQRELRGLNLRKANTSLIEKIVLEFKLILAKLGWRNITDQDMIDMMFRVAEFARKADPGFLAKRAARVDRMREAALALENAEGIAKEKAGYFVERQFTMSELAKFKDKLTFVHDDKGGMQVFTSDGKNIGYILPKVSEEVLRASPGIQSWSIKGSKDAPTKKTSTTRTFSMLGQARKDDPDLDRFLEKISHGKHSKIDSLKDWWYQFRTNFREAAEREIFDMYAGIRRREQELGIFGEQSGYMSVRLAAGVDVMVRSAIEHGVPIWEDGWVKIDESQMALLDVLAPISQNAEMLKMFEAFIVARRAKGLSKEGRERLIKREEIAAVLKYVRKHKLYGLFRDTQRELAEYKKQVLNFAEEAGVINKETRKLWERADHVPFYRVLTQNDRVGPFAASRMGHIKNPIRRLTGGQANLRPPLDSIVQNLSMLMEAAIKNKAMTDVVNNFNGTGIVTKAPQAELSSALIPLDQIQDRLDEAGVSIDAVGRDMLKGISKLTSLQAPTDDNVVSILENGKKQYYYIHDPSIMRGLESVTPKQWNAVMRILRAPKKWLTWSITRMPDFILKNWFRDMWHAWVLSRHGVIAPGYDSVRGWAKAIRQDETFRDMMAGGGVFQAGYVNAADPRGTDMAIRKKVLGKGRHGILDTPHKLWRFYTHIADGAENAHRVAVYQKTLKKTGSRKQALFESRDLMDFSVRGAHPIIRFLVETVPFWGARMQGIQRTYKGFKEDWKTTFVRAVPIMIASVAYYAWIRDDERYKALNEYDKRMYYHFFDVFEKGDHWRLPSPFEIGAMFSQIPMVLTEYTLSEQPDRGKALAQAIYFIGGEMLSLKPEIQIGMPFWELYINEHSFTGTPIVPHYMKDGNMPQGQYDYRTNVTIKWLAQNMPESAPDFMKSPKQLEHLVRGYFGSLMDYTFVATDHIYYQTHKDEAEPPSRRYDEMPFVKAFRREERGKYDTYIDQMYNTLEEADKIYRRVTQLKDEGEREEARELEMEHRALMLSRARMKPAEKRISKINKQIRQIYERENLSPTDKRERIDKLLERRSKEAERVYDYRPGGTKNKYEGGERKQSHLDAILDAMQGKSKKEQVDELISNNLPHTATLINDITISPDKLKELV